MPRSTATGDSLRTSARRRRLAQLARRRRQPRGFVFYRWLRPKSPMPTPTAELMPLAQVYDHLPADHPELDQAAQDAQLSARRRWYAARFQS